MRQFRGRHIDWRRQFVVFKEYLDGDGGVVNVRYNGSRCGANAFLEILTATFESRGDEVDIEKPVGTSIRLDPRNYKVRYLSGIRGEFDRKLGRTPTQSSSPVALPGNAQILSQNTAGGNQTIEANINIDVAPMMCAESHDWVASLSASLSDYLSTSRFMLVLVAGTSEEQQDFWATLWPQLSWLTSKGLLLVRLLDESSNDYAKNLDECAADSEVILQSSLDESSAEHAIDDIANMIKEILPGQDSVRGNDQALGYVYGHVNDVSALHNDLISFITLMQGR
ncbi:hypothetical protein [Pseudomonas huaxiensis]|uniref:hypothetical protein n=1 Tax=Pseudomonas huaxiensis TaxID=2213017 RepID=UPI0013007D0A|nr:hypothetical protein [Pseudomonas huaxiensis]